ncbi:MAG TPA: NIPSNAP family protein [Sphingomicrobium sp.]|nr:NIPSNAP family protein [Sphingomicrobium sp.]
MFADVTIELRYGALADFIETMSRVAAVVTDAGWELREALVYQSGRLFTVRHVWKLRDLNHYQEGRDALRRSGEFPAISELLSQVIERETIVFATSAPYAPAR